MLPLLDEPGHGQGRLRRRRGRRIAQRLGSQGQRHVRPGQLLPRRARHGSLPVLVGDDGREVRPEADLGAARGAELLPGRRPLDPGRLHADHERLRSRAVRPDGPVAQPGGAHGTSVRRHRDPGTGARPLLRSVRASRLRGEDSLDFGQLRGLEGGRTALHLHAADGDPAGEGDVQLVQLQTALRRDR